MREIMDEKVFSIQIAAELSGVSAHTIRAWEKRYQALTPKRSDSGRRMYSTSEVDRLKLLSHLTRLGSSIGQIAKLPDLELNEIYLKLSTNDLNAAHIEEEAAPLDLESTLQQLLEASKTYQMDLISLTLEKLKYQIPPKDMALKILSPLLKEVQLLKFSLAQIHALKAILKFHAGAIIFSQYEKKNKFHTKVALTTLEGDYQTFDLLLATLLCCHHGLNFFYLNANLPTSSIIEATKATEASVLILTIGKGQQIDINQSIHRILSHISDKTKVCLLGDLLLEDLSSKWKNLNHVKSLEELDLYLGKL
jgi:DNA-binding transcriptional MerR regulator